MNESIKNSISTVSGACAGIGVQVLGGKYISKIANYAVQNTINTKVPNQDIDSFKKAAQEILTKEGLDEHGVKIMDYSQDNGREFIDNFEREIIEKTEKKFKNKTSKHQKKLKEKTINRFKNLFESIKNGTNAFYTTETGERLIIINMNKFPNAVFHEFGHAKNHKNLGKIGELIVYKYLRNKKYSGRISALIFFTSIFTNKKKDKNEKPKNPLYPIAEFVKNNCGKLIFLAYLPLLIEETIASIRGQKMAIKYLPKNLVKYATKTHINSFMNYLKTASFPAILIYMSNLTRDKTKDYIDKIYKSNPPKIETQHTENTYLKDFHHINNFIK